MKFNSVLKDDNLDKDQENSIKVADKNHVDSFNQIESFASKEYYTGPLHNNHEKSLPIDDNFDDSKNYVRIEKCKNKSQIHDSR